MGWDGLPDIDAVADLDGQDQQVLAEIRAVLERHGALERFGVTLLHSHFVLEPGEVLVETVDHEQRKLTIRPMAPSDVKAGNLVATSFRLDSPTSITPLHFCWRPKGSDIHANGW